MVRVSFILKAPLPNSQDRIYVTGNTKSFGPWDAKKLPLLQVENGSWVATCKLPMYEQIELKFTRGTFDTEESDVAGQPLVHQFILTKDTVIKDFIYYWEDVQSGQIATVPDAPPPSVENVAPEGKVPVEIVKPPFIFVRKHTDLVAKGVQKRDITIYLPPAYETDENRHFPVLYVHDGQQRHYSKNSFHGQDWQVNDIAKELMQAGQLQEIILVVLHNQNDPYFRSFSTAVNPEYRQFMTENVKPFVDENYRTQQAPEATASMGSDMGGLLAMALAWEHPQDFGKAICFSPVFDFTRYYFTYCKKVRDTNDFRNVQLYFDSGSTISERRSEESIERMMNVLYEKGYSPTFRNRQERTYDRIRDALLSMFAR